MGRGQKKSHRATETGQNTEQYPGWREHHDLLMQMLRQHWGLLGITLEPDSVKNLLQSNICGGGLLVETGDSAAAHSEDLGLESTKSP